MIRKTLNNFNRINNSEEKPTYAPHEPDTSLTPKSFEF